MEQDDVAGKGGTVREWHSSVVIDSHRDIVFPGTVALNVAVSRVAPLAPLAGPRKYQRV